MSMTEIIIKKAAEVNAARPPNWTPALFSLAYILEVPAAVGFLWWIVY